MGLSATYFLAYITGFIIIASLPGLGDDNGLRLQFYNSSCPNAENIARQVTQQGMNRDPTAPAALLRLSFHDCQVDGCDASVLLHSSPPGIVAETVSERNFGLRRQDLIDDIKSELERACPQTVSCADIIQMAARDAVVLSGGPFIPILTGRRDGINASNIRADKQLPPATLSVGSMLQIFSEKNISAEDGVALLGAHTLGVGHCINFENRLSPQGDPNMSPILSAALRMLCRVPAPFSNVTFAPNDLTNFIFDNQYFRDIRNGRGLLTVDSEIALDPRTSVFVSIFSQNQQYFFDRFSAAFLQLSQYNVLTGDQGQIRKDCKFVNS
ncbi:hypothetical protein SUGI_0601030 [Cryptomeria japonica]|uniref:peroxidase 29 n=1 Tax=Cryptomeria japonica TaxID=3369 RepID=UPI00241471B1|nr:peroxidase 29 [Cryptomeria japonica]GLJ30379.1 hypothetical protein SUGI_0601030 [Cryptomeria japonica]